MRTLDGPGAALVRRTSALADRGLTGSLPVDSDHYLAAILNTRDWAGSWARFPLDVSRPRGMILGAARQLPTNPPDLPRKGFHGGLFKLFMA